MELRDHTPNSCRPDQISTKMQAVVILKTGGNTSPLPLPTTQVTQPRRVGPRREYLKSSARADHFFSAIYNRVQGSISFSRGFTFSDLNGGTFTI